MCISDFEDLLGACLVGWFQPNQALHMHGAIDWLAAVGTGHVRLGATRNFLVSDGLGCRSARDA